MLGLLLDGACRVDRIARGRHTGDGADFAIVGHQTGIHLRQTRAGQGRAASGVELGGILHDADGGADRILRRRTLLEQRISGFEGAAQVLLRLGPALRGIVLAAVAGTGVDDQQDAVLGSGEFADHVRRGSGLGHGCSSFISEMAYGSGTP